MLNDGAYFLLKMRHTFMVLVLLTFSPAKYAVKMIKCKILMKPVCYQIQFKFTSDIFVYERSHIVEHSTIKHVYCQHNYNKYLKIHL